MEEEEIENEMDKAIIAVRGGMGIRSAGKKFSISKSTLHRNTTQSVVLNVGRQTYLTFADEERLIAVARDMATRGFGLTKAEFLEVVTQIVNSTNPLNTPLISLSHKWWEGLKGRHPNFTCIRQKGRASRDKSDAEQNEDGILSFYELLENLMLKHNFTPSQVWNADETGTSQKEGSSHVVGDKRDKVARAKVGSKAPHLTILACVSGSGEYSPPLFICQDKVDEEVLVNALPGSTAMTSPSGYISEIIFNEWFVKWIVWIRIKTSQTILLILDNCACHVRYSTILLAQKNNIELLSLPPNLTHILQPLDVSIYRSLKAQIRSSLLPRLKLLKVNKLDHSQYIGLLSQLWSKVFTIDKIQSSFIDVGLFPINPEKAFHRLKQDLLFSDSKNDPIEVEVKQSREDKLVSTIAELKTEIVNIHLKAAFSANESLIPVKRKRKLKCFLAHVMTQEEISDSVKSLPKPTVKKKSKRKLRKRKPTIVLGKKRTTLIRCQCCPDLGVENDCPDLGGKNSDTYFTWLYQMPSHGEMTDYFTGLETKALQQWLHQLHYMNMIKMQNNLEQVVLNILSDDSKAMNSREDEFAVVYKWLSLSRQYHCVELTKFIEHEYLLTLALNSSLPDSYSTDSSDSSDDDDPEITTVLTEQDREKQIANLIKILGPNPMKPMIHTMNVLGGRANIAEERLKELNDWLASAREDYISRSEFFFYAIASGIAGAFCSSIVYWASNRWNK